jgi:hypothetical protein
MSDCCKTPTQQFFSYFMAEQVNLQWDDDEVRFVRKTNMISWIFIVLVYWNNSDISSHSDTLSWFRANNSLHFLLNAAEKPQIPMLDLRVFSLTQPGVKPMIYCTRGEQANHYTIDAV